mmetsp:Transcript_1669/g.5003  ORF Transcript_1669/g.5003 Transcript_1669/m.5003 type:complete len:204 (+) Transcript_1669:510-1121(+)
MRWRRRERRWYAIGGAAVAGGGARISEVAPCISEVGVAEFGESGGHGTQLAEAEGDGRREAELDVGDAVLLREGAHARRDVREAVARQLREEVVLNLPLEAAVEPVRPPVRRDVARREQLRLEDTHRRLLRLRELRCHHVREQQLHVQHAHHGVVHRREEQACEEPQDGGERGGFCSTGVITVRTISRTRLCRLRECANGHAV